MREFLCIRPRRVLVAVGLVWMTSSSIALAQSASVTSSEKSSMAQTYWSQKVSADDDLAGSRVFVVLPFGAAGTEYANTACTAADASAGATSTLLDELTLATVRQVASRGKVTVLDSARHAPVGATIVSGCVIRAIPGNATARLIGMGMGASELGVHVQVLRKTTDGSRLVSEFDASVRGASSLPPLGPIGLILHAKRASKLTLAGDASKLAVQIATDVFPGT